MKAKILVYGLTSLILTTIHLAEAQQARKSPLIGYLRQGSPTSAKSEDEAFRQGLRDPGGNITGSTGIAPDLSGKRLELLREAVPKASRVAVVWSPSKDAADDAEVKETETAARQLGIKIQPIRVQETSQFQNSYDQAAKQHAHAVIIIQGAFTLAHRVRLAELAAQRRLPSMFEQAAWTNDGCLLSYGRDQLAQWRRAAYFVDRIMKGTRPADLPVEQPMKFEFIVNLKTAKQIGLTIPPNVLARADRVIK